MISPLKYKINDRCHRISHKLYSSSIPTILSWFSGLVSCHLSFFQCVEVKNIQPYGWQELSLSPFFSLHCVTEKPAHKCAYKRIAVTWINIIKTLVSALKWSCEFCCSCQATMATHLMDRHCQLQVRQWMKCGEMVRTQMCILWHHQSDQLPMTDSTTTSHGRIQNPAHISSSRGRIIADDFTTLMCFSRSVRGW